MYHHNPPAGGNVHQATGLPARIRIARSCDIHRPDRSRLSLQGLADALGLPYKQIVFRWEHGESEPDHAMLVRIAEVTHVDLNWLLTGEGHHAPNSPHHRLEPDNGRAERVRCAREDKRWTQAKLARVLCVRVRAIEAWEGGETGLSHYDIDRIAEATGTTHEYLRTGEL